MGTMLGLSLSLPNTRRAGGGSSYTPQPMVIGGDSYPNGTVASDPKTGAILLGYPGITQYGSGGLSIFDIETALYAVNEPDRPTFVWDGGLNDTQYTDIQDVLDAYTRINSWLTGWRKIGWPSRRDANSTQELSDALLIEAHIKSINAGAFWDWRPFLQISDGSPAAIASVAADKVPEYLLKDGTHFYQASKIAIEQNILSLAVADGATDAYTAPTDLLGGISSELITFTGDGISVVDGKIVVVPGSGTRVATWNVEAPAASYNCRVVIEGRTAGNCGRRFNEGGTTTLSNVTTNGDTTQVIDALGNTTYQLTFAGTSNLTVSLATVSPTA